MKAHVVQMPRALRGLLLTEAARAAPRECCGLLVGRGLAVRFAVPARNVARRSSRYQVDPRLHLDLQRVLRRAVPPFEVIGAYHSHPSGPAWPSPRDVADAHDPRWLHVIVGRRRTGSMVAAFRITAERVHALAICWT